MDDGNEIAMINDDESQPLDTVEHRQSDTYAKFDRTATVGNNELDYENLIQVSPK